VSSDESNRMLYEARLILSEPFDYTEMQKNLYGDMLLDYFYGKVKAARGS
jgi:hypothetical protein